MSVYYYKWSDFCLRGRKQFYPNVFLLRLFNNQNKQDDIFHIRDRYLPSIPTIKAKVL